MLQALITMRFDKWCSGDLQLREHLGHKPIECSRVIRRRWNSSQYHG